MYRTPKHTFHVQLLFSCRLRDNAEKYGRAGQATDVNISRSMRQTEVAIDTRSEYVTRIVFPQKWLREPASKLHLYQHYPSCYNKDGMFRISKQPNALIIHFNY